MALLLAVVRGALSCHISCAVSIAGMLTKYVYNTLCSDDEEYVPPKPESVEIKEDDAFYTVR